MFFRSQSLLTSHLWRHQVATVSIKLFPILETVKISHLRSTYALLFGLAEVVAEVKVAGRFGNGWGGVRYRHVFQIQEAELDFH